MNHNLIVFVFINYKVKFMFVLKTNGYTKGHLIVYICKLCMKLNKLHNFSSYIKKQ